MVIQNLFTSYFTSHNLTYDLNDFDGRSDYEGFIEVNVPGTATAVSTRHTRQAVNFCTYQLSCTHSGATWL